MSADCKSVECHALFFVVIAGETLQEPVPKFEDLCEILCIGCKWIHGGIIHFRD